MKKNTLFVLITALLLAACAGLSTLEPTAEPVLETQAVAQAVTAEGKLLPAVAVELGFAQAGLVSEVLVQPGQTLAAGDPIARLVGREAAQAELAAARLEQTLAQQALDSLQRSTFQTAVQAETMLQQAQKAYEREANRWSLGNPENASDLELALDDYVQAEQDYRQAREKLQDLLDEEETNRERRDAQDDLDSETQSFAEAYADLKESLAADTQPLEERLSLILSPIATLETAREQVNRLEGSLDPELLAAAESRLEAATAHIAAAEVALGTFELCAPFEGTLLSMDLLAGEAVLPGVPVAYLADTASWIVETTDLPESYAPRISPGDSAMIKLDAFSGEEFSGKVSAIDPVGRNYQGDMVFTITIMLDTADEHFMWNMTASVTIDTEQ